MTAVTIIVVLGIIVVFLGVVAKMIQTKLPEEAEKAPWEIDAVDNT